MTQMELAREFCSRLEIIYPEAQCALEAGGEAWKLLIMGRLSAQCTDARVNIVCRELFAKMPSLEAVADCDLAELEEIGEGRREPVQHRYIGLRG